MTASTLSDHSPKRLAIRLEKAAAHHSDDPYKHAQHIKNDVKPAMADLREVVDNLETWVSSEYWPLPTYQDMLFLE